MIDINGSPYVISGHEAVENEEDQLEKQNAMKDMIEDKAVDYRPDQVTILGPETMEPPEIKVPRPAARRGLGNSYRTGPKGVRADYEEAKLCVIAHRLKQKN